MNFDILGISELKWTGMGELNLDDHFLFFPTVTPLSAQRDGEMKGTSFWGVSSRRSYRSL